MTTFQIPAAAQGWELAQALADTARYASPDAVAGLAELRVTANPDNRNTVAHVGWAEREPVSRALRATADAGHPLGGRLRDLAQGLDDSVAAQRLNRPHL
jgi:hypothetical protein